MTVLSSDRPSVDPKDDLFGHAPFAQSLANSISNYHGSDGMVMALYGPWGAGKSTVLSYVRCYLELLPEQSKPIIVPFNPWWFSGQEHLARAFLGQFQAVLPTKNDKFKKLGNLIGEFAESVGGLIDLSGQTFGAASGVGKLLGRFFSKQPKDVPALKAEISNILRDAGKRILIVVDDIDRLTPDETRQLFTVIKGLADFPNVVYLLAFDRDVAAQAIEQQGGLPGSRYLEKIIQVPFELPPIDRTALRAALFQRLGEVLGDVPDGLFDHDYWSNVFNDGIDNLITVPRDVVRFTNTLSVTYPAVRGEVNAVDFIALEALRVFLPNLYDVIRRNPDKFAGSSDLEYGHDRAANEAFRDRWMIDIPETLKESSQALIERIFPKTNRSLYGREWLADWRRSLQACHPEIFPTYFRLSILPGAIRRDEILMLLTLAEDPPALAETFIQATSIFRPDGSSKVRALLERLLDHVDDDISEVHIPVFISVLLDIGDELVLSSDERGSFDFGNESRIGRIIYRLLQRVPEELRLPFIRTAFEKGQGIYVQRYLVVALSGMKDDKVIFDIDSLGELKILWIQRLRNLAFGGGDLLLKHTKLAEILRVWREWGDEAEVRGWCKQATATDEGLLNFLPSFCRHSKSQIIGDSAIKIQPRLNPEWLEPYLNTAECAQRFSYFIQAEQVPENALEAVSQYLQEFGMLREGRNPDDVDAFDDRK